MIHSWKRKNETPPNDIGLSFATFQKLGVRANLPLFNKRAQFSVRADYDKSF